MRKPVTAAILSCLFIFTACQKGELPIPKHISGNIFTGTVNLSPSYKYQVYYDLKSNKVVGQNLKTDWDLGFEASETGDHVILNSAKAMYAYNTGIKDFDSVKDTTGMYHGKKMEHPAGNLDSTAIGDWRKSSAVYIIDRGYNENGIHQGFRKILFQSADKEKYVVRFAKSDGSEETLMTINKDSRYNFSFLSFTISNTILVEPPKAEWDIVFTQYLEAIPSPYLVTGAVLNRYNTSAKIDTLLTFENLSFAYTQAQTLSKNINTIGYSWKTYDFNTSSYLIHTKMNYILKDNEGFYYALHFTDFYDASGNKGNPTWEYKKL